MTGKIIKGIGGFYYVKTESGEVVECRARGVFRKENVKPYVGDDVEFSRDAKMGYIERIMPRKTMLLRPAVANIDAVVIVLAAKEPEPDTLLCDKIILSAEIAGIEPMICVNKTDLCSAEELVKTYINAGYKAFCVSAKDENVRDVIMPYIKGRTTAFSGLSGVGKSTLLGILTGKEQETGEVSQKIKRGRHTTRCVELLELASGGYVLDTPGFSSFEIGGITADALKSYFPEMRGLGEKCRFKGCSHTDEPDCAVKAELLKGNISESRYESYKIFYDTLKRVKEWENK